ncbi:hypothetical protein MtrunA17_Chr7g0257441 [Medicago truncatula]|uniref:Uncharacterized protein n=1 Tax=Medicago truncatula TaxID=3880 RepID=A0A396H3L7_MEDTR|nr:hypothetical protein MtrunA17_Chr7g0257441 [Medicago truncatula]
MLSLLMWKNNKRIERMKFTIYHHGMEMECLLTLFGNIQFIRDSRSILSLGFEGKSGIYILKLEKRYNMQNGTLKL